MTDNHPGILEYMQNATITNAPLVVAFHEPQAPRTERDLGRGA